MTSDAELTAEQRPERVSDSRPEPVEGQGIVLVGAPGSGKSTVGAMLADRLGLSFTDVDVVIAERAGKSIADLFTVDGEPAFRALERATTLEVMAGGGVVSLGGGAVTSAEIRARLVGHQVVWLQVNATSATHRIGMNESRPLLLGNVRGQLIRLMNERAVLYREVATITVPTDDHDVDAVVELIMTDLARS